MGLRIANAPVGVLNLIRNIGVTQKALELNSQRLATGLRINNASDDPGGLFMAERLRAQIASINTSITSNDLAINKLNTADSGLAGINTLLSSIRASVVKALGPLTADEMATEQANVDTALAAIDALAQNTSFGNKQLLSGSSGISTSGVDANLLDLLVRSTNLAGTSSKSFTFNVASVGTRANAQVDAVAGNSVNTGGADATIRITGPKGSVDVTVANGTDATAFAVIINANAGSTGVVAGPDGGGGIDVETEFAGSDQSFTISQVGGAGTFDPGTLTDTGTDLVGDINGTNVFAQGNFVFGVRSDLNVKFKFDEAGGAGAFNFTVNDSGLTFSLGPNGNNNITIGIPSQNTAVLGAPAITVFAETGGGFLNSLLSAGANDLSTDPGNALTIVDDAISDVLSTRGYLGSIISNLFESNQNLLSAQLSSTTNSLSDIVDLDFAAETAAFTRNQILQQVQVATLASMNLLAGSVLDLLKFS